MGISEFVKFKRKDKDWSQRDLATASGISNAEISRIESGQRKDPSPKVLKSLASALNVPIEEMLMQADVIEKGNEFVKKHADEPAPDFTRQSFSSSASSRYVQLNDLSDEEIEDVKKYIEFIKSRRQ